MSLKLQNFLFSGPYDPARTIVRKNKAACVFAVISREGKPYNPDFRVIDIGDTRGDTVAFAEHPDLSAWQAEAGGELGLYFFRPDAGEPEASAIRSHVVAVLRGIYTPPTGIIAIDGSV